MVNRTFWKTCVRSVRSSFSRFFAIFAIVALGCFLAALLAARGGCRKLLQGGLSALTAFLLLLICGMLLFSGGVDGGRLLMSLGAAALGGVGGAFLAGALE